MAQLLGWLKGRLKQSIPVLICPRLDIDAIPETLNKAFGIEINKPSTLWLFDIEEREDAHPIEFTPKCFLDARGYVLISVSAVKEFFDLAFDESVSLDELEFVELVASDPDYCKKLSDFVKIKILGR